MTVSYPTMLQDDWELRDDLEDVSLTNGVTGVVVAGIKACNRALNWREVGLGGSLGLEPKDKVWMLGRKQMGSAVPDKGDMITQADGTEWVVVSGTSYNFAGTTVYYEAVARVSI